MADAPYLSAIFLGVVEGITEFLPVSSTGHLIFFSDLLGVHDEAGKVFEIFIQLGAILAVCWEYRRVFWSAATGVLSRTDDRRFVLNLVIAFIPSAVMGLLLYSVIKDHLFSTRVVGFALVAGGIAFLWIERVGLKPGTHDTREVTPLQALKIGIAQTLALVPGVSRSGATILGGMLSGLDRRSATEFSFFLAVPTMFAAVGYDLLRSWDALEPGDLGRMAVGFAVAFVSALAAIRLLIRYVSTRDFRIFGWYRIGFGLVVLAFAFRGAGAPA